MKWRANHLLGGSAATVLCAVALIACGSQSGTGVRTGASGTAETSSTSAPPAQNVPITGYAVAPPDGLTELRSYDVAAPNGGTAHIKWFGLKGGAPTVTSNLLTEDGAGIKAMDMAKTLAAEHMKTASSIDKALPAPKDVTINGKPGYAYSDPLGWRAVLWVADDNAVMSVTALRMDDSSLVTFAESVQCT